MFFFLSWLVWFKAFCCFGLNQGSLLKNFCCYCGVNELENTHSTVLLCHITFHGFSNGIGSQFRIFCGTPAISDGNLGGCELGKY